MRTRIRIWPALSIGVALLAGCVAPSAGLGMPTATSSTTAPMPTALGTISSPIVAPSATLATTTAPSATPMPVMPRAPDLSITPVVSGGTIQVDSWSPDGKWLAFWQAEVGARPSSVGPPMTLHFYHVRTGETCSCPESETTGRQRYYQSTTWTADGQFLIWDGEKGKQAAPCQGGFRPTGEAALSPTPKSISASPAGGYRVSTAYTRRAGPGFDVVSTFTEVASDHSIMTVAYTVGQGDTPLIPADPGGEWVTDRLFLIYYTLERGPLLVDLAQERVVQVAELFGVKWDPEPSGGFAARGQVAPGTGDYHIALTPWPALLYHLETGEVEVIAEGDHPIFTRDGQWLLTYTNISAAAPGVSGTPCGETLWVRPVDPPGSRASAVVVGDIVTAPLSPDGTRLTIRGKSGACGMENVISVYSFPEGSLLASWSTGQYFARPIRWSPDGKRLAIVGIIPTTDRGGLFIVEP